MKKIFFSIIIVFFFTSIIFTSSQGPVTHTIKMTNNRYTPSELKINIGDIVIFEWAENAQGHNVAQSSGSKSLKYNGGFRSGDSTGGPISWQLPLEYTRENTTLFYICEPHASGGMRGMIIVGTGGTVQEDAPGFLFIAFLISSLILVSILRKNRNH